MSQAVLFCVGWVVGGFVCGFMQTWFNKKEVHNHYTVKDAYLNFLPGSNNEINNYKKAE